MASAEKKHTTEGTYRFWWLSLVICRDLTTPRQPDRPLTLDFGRERKHRLFSQRLADNLQADRKAVGIEPAGHGSDGQAGQTQDERRRDPVDVGLHRLAGDRV